MSPFPGFQRSFFVFWPCDMRDLPWPRIEPVPPALAVWRQALDPQGSPRDWSFGVVVFPLATEISVIVFPLALKAKPSQPELLLSTWQHYSHQYGFCLIFCHFHSFPPTSLTTLLLLFSYVWLFETPWTAACLASLSFTISWSLLKLMSIELVMPFNHLKFCCPLLLLLTIFPSIRVFSNESVLHIR